MRAMKSWRDQILAEFTPGVARLTLVADPDGLLLEEGVLAGIRERGFEVVPFEDRVAFRYAYESRFRSRWDRGEEAALVVVVRSGPADLSSLPHDLLQAGRMLSFNLGDIFPDLSYPVVASLDRGDLDTLYEAQAKYAPGRLGDNATKEFILRHVFGIAPELIKEPRDLLRVLLRRHYRGQRVPADLDERLLQLLRQDDAFKDWPLEVIVPDREAFLAFLQERWPIFLSRLATEEGASGIEEEVAPYGLAYPGPAYLPFDDGDVRVYLDNLFLERLLQPVPHRAAAVLRQTWVSIGLRLDLEEDRLRRMAKLLENLRSSIPGHDARHEEWLRFARGWAELTVLAYTPEDGPAVAEANEAFQELRLQVDAAFAAWLGRRYAGLSNLPPVLPVMVHHIPRALAHQLGAQAGGRLALIIIDGLSLDQWTVVRDTLLSRRPRLRFREGAVFAWIPTVTSLSRQAILAGRPPALFPQSIYTTDKEEALWAQFWADQGLASKEAILLKGSGVYDLERVAELLSYSRTKVVGLVIDKVDRIMHGMELGTAGMYNQVRQWARQPYLADFLEFLLESGFQVFLTSDHGNIEAEGCGRPAEGAVADLRGERVRIYADAVLRDKVHARFPGSVKWPPLGLPENYLPLIAPGRRAFAPEGKRIVCHGGLSLEEVIVPFIQVEVESAPTSFVSAPA